MIVSPADLKYFSDVAKTLNMSRSAERLGISQPSISLALQRLEHNIGTPLFIRSKRGVTLTQAGKQLHTHVSSLLQSWDDIKAQALASEHDVQGDYTLGIHTSMALNMLPGVLPKIMTQYPKLNITLKHDLSRNITEGIIGMNIDMGIVVNPIQHPDLIIHPLWTGEVTFWYPQTPQNETQDPTNDKAIILMDPTLIRSQNLLKSYKEQGFTYARILPSNSLEVIAELVSQGCGIGILPINVAIRASGSLKRVENAPDFKDDHCFIYRVENKNIQTIKTIFQQLKEYAKTIEKR